MAGLVVMTAVTTPKAEPIRSDTATPGSVMLASLA